MSSSTSGEEVLASSDEKDLGKALMEHLGGDPNQPMQVYRSYLRATMSSNISHSNLSRMDDALLADFYRLHEPKERPKQFDFFRAADLSKLEECLECRIVVLEASSGKRGGLRGKVHDRRIYDRPEETRIVHSFVVEKMKGAYLLKRGPIDYDVRLTECKYIAACAPKESACLVEKLRHLVGAGASGHVTHGRTCRDPLEVCARARCFREELSVPVIIASHVRGNIKGVSDQFFAVLGILRRPEEKISSCVVVCVTADRRHAYLAKEEVAASVRERSRKQRGEKRERLPAQELGWKNSSPTADLASDDGDFTSDRVVVDGCGCGPCKRGREFCDNMEIRGKQKLYLQKPSSFDYCKMFGLLNPETESALAEACRLSIGGFDVESLTLPVTECDNENSSIPFEAVSGTTLGRKIVARQVPIYVSWSDHSMDKAGIKPFMYEYDEAAPEKMAEKFVSDLVTMRAKASEAKATLLQPLFSWLSCLEEAHYRHFLGGEGDPIPSERRQRAVAAAWKSNPWGEFQRSLLALKSRYVIFGFNAEVSLGLWSAPERANHFTLYS